MSSSPIEHDSSSHNLFFMSKRRRTTPFDWAAIPQTAKAAWNIGKALANVSTQTTAGRYGGLTGGSAGRRLRLGRGRRTRYRRRFRSGRSRVITDQKDFTMRKLRGRSRRQRYRRNKIVRFKRRLDGLGVGNFIYTNPFSRITWAGDGYTQNWDVVSLGYVSELNAMRDEAYKLSQERMLVTTAGQLTVGANEALRRPTYISHCVYDIMITNQSGPQGVEVTTPVFLQGGGGGTASVTTWLEPCYIDVYEFVNKRDIASSDYSTDTTHFSSGGVPFVALTNVGGSAKYGSVAAGTSAENWGTNSDLSPFDYQSITYFWKCIKVDSFLVSNGESVRISGTIPFKKIWKSSAEANSVFRGWGHMWLFRQRGSRGSAVASPNTNRNLSMTVKTDKRWTYKPMAYHIPGIKT